LYEMVQISWRMCFSDEAWFHLSGYVN
jgi:hypothetical protein